ncbi:hypothetical protein M9H77_36173 [Catharanthus roseus]|uniref:Uncharacterized protein n=1 Tax=Catharanthus roseus TaxID=4058 RepID=A0ACB9ZT04_CATRO|nr:hypothetical protein M9H77_36173 [Catharanthus roseus]
MDESVAKQSTRIKHIIEELYVDSMPILIPIISAKILKKIIGYYMRVIGSVASGKDTAELKSFFDELVNGNEPTLFSLLLVADYRIHVMIHITFASYSTSGLNLPQKKQQRFAERILGLSTENCALESIDETSLPITFMGSRRLLDYCCV